MTVEFKPLLTCNHTLCPQAFRPRGSHSSARGVRTEARTHGWTTRQHDGQLVDYCPNHARGGAR
jgi:hypothetical protein